LFLDWDSSQNPVGRSRLTGQSCNLTFVAAFHLAACYVDPLLVKQQTQLTLGPGCSWGLFSFDPIVGRKWQWKRDARGTKTGLLILLRTPLLERRGGMRRSEASACAGPPSCGSNAEASDLRWKPLKVVFCTATFSVVVGLATKIEKTAALAIKLPQQIRNLIRTKCCALFEFCLLAALRYRTGPSGYTR
jgi:hypothetical protein